MTSGRPLWSHSHTSRVPRARPLSMSGRTHQWTVRLRSSSPCSRSCWFRLPPNLQIDEYDMFDEDNLSKLQHFFQDERRTWEDLNHAFHGQLRNDPAKKYQYMKQQSPKE